MNYETIIIGGGAAGLSAALWCAELRLATLLVEAGAELGGQLLGVHNPIKNHLGTEAANGRALRDVFTKQIENYPFEKRLQAQIVGADLKNKSVTLAAGEHFSAGAIIIASGVRRRKLNVAGEDEFVGRGIIESGRRDAATVEGKTVAVVGGGDAAFENALILADRARTVALVHRGARFRARPEFVEAARAHPRIEILTETAVRKISGGAAGVEAVELENTRDGKIFERNLNAILLRIGVVPNTDLFAGQIELDAAGYVKTDQFCETSAPGVYAAGDVANPLSPTVSTAVGMGATAAKAITNYKLQITNYKLQITNY